MITAGLFSDYSKELRDELIKIRRYLHAHPELSFEEELTSSWIKKYLEENGFEVKVVAGTGLVTVLKGGKPGKEIALRADIDALPITEKNDVPYRSVNEGMMHACGHDVHTTCLIGALLLLKRVQSDLQGSVKAIFQPGEEKLPGGATLILKEGVLNPAPDFILGQHVYPELPAGKVGFRPGVYMASTDELYFRVKGRGGHGALPHRNIDPVPAAAMLITGLQQIVSRRARPDIPTVLSIGKVIANGATNIIPDEVYLEGTFRTLNEEWRAEAHKEIEQVATNICEAFGATCETEIRKGYPVLENDPETTEQVISAAKEFLGEENVVSLDVRMTAEDFAWYSQEMKSCFYRLGTSSADGRYGHPVHSALFDIDESALITGSGLMAWLAYKGLS